MKKPLYLAVAILGILAFGSLTSCQDEDFGVSTAVLKEKAFEQGFIKEFGKPSADQSWDFYAQQMEAIRRGAGKTRATMADPDEVTVSNASQPTDKDYFNSIVSDVKMVLEDEINNSHVGQNHYELTSTGTFNVYAILYAGDYEKYSKFNLDFGIAYMNGNTEVRKKLFGYKSGSGEINPGYAKQVYITPGASFYFYMSITPSGSAWNPTYYRFYSNSSTYKYGTNVNYLNNNGTLIGKDGNTYDGASTLVYSMEVNDEAEGDKQIMIIGFEDGWAGTADLDFNDLVIMIEGDLPVPAAKRFFCEDKESLDWDYNDVVFDVMNSGIVLRAVGGTLPVWLLVKNRESNEYKDIGGELHELMRSKQFQTSHQNAQLTYRRKDENGEEKTFYRPIDVGVEHGLWLDPVQVVRWTTSMQAGQPDTRLREGEVERFANPFVNNPVGGLKLVVGSEYGQTLADAIERATVDMDSKETIIEIDGFGSIPAIWSGPVSVRWMKELEKITKGYPDFYGGGTPAESGSQPQWWVSNINTSYMYDFWGDGGDTL
ncbi:MAG: hypothetical protein IKX25_01060 [Bacteroidales bacterium]|nr:hypothetical protein [Bacteroidales bacterium]